MGASTVPQLANQPVLSAKENLLKIQVELGGGIFRAYWDADMRGIEPMVLFDSPQTKSTLGLPVSKVSASAVREQIRKSDAAFEMYAEKASRFVLRQFAQTGELKVSGAVTVCPE
jgi:hypothetical protein